MVRCVTCAWHAFASVDLTHRMFRVLSISSGFVWSPISFTSPLPPRCSHLMFARSSRSTSVTATGTVARAAAAAAELMQAQAPPRCSYGVAMQVARSSEQQHAKQSAWWSSTFPPSPPATTAAASARCQLCDGVVRHRAGWRPTRFARCASCISDGML